MDIAPELQDHVIDHARREAPNECCGLIAMHDGAATKVIEFENVAASPFRFEIDGLALMRVLDRLEEDGQTFAIYHSHTRSEPYPSQTDLNFAAKWPGVEWLIVGLSDGIDSTAVLRSYRIQNSNVIEVEAGFSVDAYVRQAWGNLHTERPGSRRWWRTFARVLQAEFVAGWNVA